MNLHISEGNMKIGAVPNVNLPPIQTCRPDVPCASRCYAMKAWHLYPNVRKNYSENLALWNSDPNSYFEQLAAFLSRRNPPFFRFHCSGDIPDTHYWLAMNRLAAAFPSTKFLTHTKKDFGPSFTRNLVLIQSSWLPPWTVEDFPEDRPSSIVFKSHKDRDSFAESTEFLNPGSFLPCPNDCTSCEFRCWDLKPGQTVGYVLH